MNDRYGVKCPQIAEGALKDCRYKTAPLLRAANCGYAYLYGRGQALAVQKKPSTFVRPTPTEPITCSHCGGRAYLMRRTLHPKIKGEIWTFECKDCGKQTEKSVLH